MKKTAIGSMIALLCVILAGCGKCEHEYDNGVITKKPTCTEEGEKTFTCSLCEETKTESVAKSHIHIRKRLQKTLHLKKKARKLLPVKIVVIHMQNLFLFEMMKLL